MTRLRNWIALALYRLAYRIATDDVQIAHRVRIRGGLVLKMGGISDVRGTEIQPGEAYAAITMSSKP